MWKRGEGFPREERYKPGHRGEKHEGPDHGSLIRILDFIYRQWEAVERFETS